MITDVRAVAWAVHLGANTARRLAAEWGITAAEASIALRVARGSRLLEVSKRGHRTKPNTYRSTLPDHQTTNA